jgi:hypothetical protein
MLLIREDAGGSGSGNASLPHDDESRSHTIVLWVLAGMTTVFILLRLYCRFRSGKVIWWDEHFLVSAYVSLHLDSF